LDGEVTVIVIVLHWRSVIGFDDVTDENLERGAIEDGVVDIEEDVTRARGDVKPDAVEALSIILKGSESSCFFASSSSSEIFSMAISMR